MEISKEGLAELASREGLALTKYLDSKDVETIGFGSTASDIPDLHLWGWDKKITIEQAVEMYKRHIHKYVAGVNRALTKLDIPQHKFDALVSICYNIGIGGMSKSTFMKYVNEGRSNEEVVRAIRMWNKPPEIRGRRLQEANLYAEGVYTSGGEVLLFPVSSKTHNPIYSKGTKINLFRYL